MRIKKVFTQKRLPGIGAVKDIMIHSAFYFSIVNFGLIAATAYNTTLRPYFQQYTPWINFPLFISILAGIAVGTMLLEYKFVLPSYYAFRGKQYWKHESDLAVQLRTLTKKIESLEGKIEEKKQPNR